MTNYPFFSEQIPVYFDIFFAFQHPRIPLFIHNNLLQPLQNAKRQTLKYAIFVTFFFFIKQLIFRRKFKRKTGFVFNVLFDFILDYEIGLLTLYDVGGNVTFVANI